MLSESDCIEQSSAVRSCVSELRVSSKKGDKEGDAWLSFLPYIWRMWSYMIICLLKTVSVVAHIPSSQKIRSANWMSESAEHSDFCDTNRVINKLTLTRILPTCIPWSSVLSFSFPIWDDSGIALRDIKPHLRIAACPNWLVPRMTNELTKQTRWAII